MEMEQEAVECRGPQSVDTLAYEMLLVGVLD
jgi:hypothetical protein